MKLQELMNTYPNLSLKTIATHTDCCYQYLLKASKKPVANQSYDPKAFNYNEVEKLIAKKADLSTIDFATISANTRTITPAAKFEDFQINDDFTMRGTDEVFTIIYSTETHVVIQNIPGSTQPRVLNIATFLHQSPKAIIVE